MHELLLRYMEVSQITLATSTLSNIYIYRTQFFERTLRQRGLDSELNIATRYRLDCSGSNSCERNIFSLLHTSPERPWDPSSLLCNVYRVCFPLIKRLGRGINHLPQSSAEVKKRVEMYLYSPYVPTWEGIGYLPLPLHLMY